MNIRPITELMLYRYRYIIGYVLVALLAVGLLLLNFDILPSGMSQAEQASAVAAKQIVLDKNILQTVDAVNLPYHLLQKASLDFFGLSPIGVRLPSIVLATISAVLLFLMLRRWLQNNVAVVMGLFIVTSTWFLSIGRAGTPEIMVIFWTALIFYLSTLVSQESKWHRAWKAGSLLSIALSLYTPYMLYVFIAAAIASLTQPHLRYIVRFSEKTSVGLGVLFFIAIMAPLGYHMYRDPAIIWQLLAIPTNLPDPIQFGKDLIANASVLVNPFRYSAGIISTPLITITTTVFALIGAYRLISDWHSVRSHVLLLWLAILIPVVGLDKSHSLVVLFVPIQLIAAIGVQSLFQYWYRLFPRNPYARAFGLLPIGLLLFSILQFNYQRYFIGLPYSPKAAVSYNQDPFILHRALTAKQYRDQRVLLVAPDDKQALYSLEQKQLAGLQLTTGAQFTGTDNATSVIIAESELAKLSPPQLALLPTGKTSLLVNERRDDGLRFRIYSQ